MLKNKCYGLSLIIVSGLLFSGSAFAGDIENIEKECREATKDLIKSIKGTTAGYLPDNVRVNNAEFETASNMKVKTSYTNKQYTTECRKKLNNAQVTVNIVVDVNEN